jgi:hypothetical protein
LQQFQLSKQNSDGIAIPRSVVDRPHARRIPFHCLPAFLCNYKDLDLSMFEKRGPSNRCLTTMPDKKADLWQIDSDNIPSRAPSADTPPNAGDKEMLPTRHPRWLRPFPTASPPRADSEDQLKLTIGQRCNRGTAIRIRLLDPDEIHDLHSPMVRR